MSSRRPTLNLAKACVGLAVVVLAASTGHAIQVYDLYDAGADPATDPQGAPFTGWSDGTTSGGIDLGGAGNGLDSATSGGGVNAWQVGDALIGAGQGDSIIYTFAGKQLAEMIDTGFTLELQVESVGSGGFLSLGYTDIFDGSGFRRVGATPGVSPGGLHETFTWSYTPGSEPTSDFGASAGGSNLFFSGPSGGALLHLADNTTGTSAMDFRLVSATLTTNAVPEPSTIALLGLGLAGLTLRRKNRQRTIALLIAAALTPMFCTDADAAVIWRRDWEALAHNTNITNANLDGGPGAAPNVGTQDLTVVSGTPRVFDSAGVGGLDVISTSGGGLFEIIVETGSTYASATEYTFDYVIGTGSSSGRDGNWFVEFGTYDGATFTALSGLDSGASSNTTGAITLLSTENFQDNTNNQPAFGYNVGGRLLSLTFDPGGNVFGENIAFRMGITSSASFAGFTDMLLDSQAVVPEPSTLLLAGFGLTVLATRRRRSGNARTVVLPLLAAFAMFSMFASDASATVVVDTIPANNQATLTADAGQTFTTGLLAPGSTVSTIEIEGPQSGAPATVLTLELWTDADQDPATWDPGVLVGESTNSLAFSNGLISTYTFSGAGLASNTVYAFTYTDGASTRIDARPGLTSATLLTDGTVFSAGAEVFGGGFETAFRLTSAVPEPSTLILAGFGLAALALRRRRSRRRR